MCSLPRQTMISHRGRGRLVTVISMLAMLFILNYNYTHTIGQADTRHISQDGLSSKSNPQPLILTLGLPDGLMEADILVKLYHYQLQSQLEQETYKDTGLEIYDKRRQHVKETCNRMNETFNSERNIRFILLSCALSCVTALDCLFCNGAERTASCTTRRCPKSEVGCYMQIDTLNNRDAIYARCISDHTCTHYGEWRGLGNWKGTFRTNGCCRSDNCNAPLVLNALNIGHHTCYVCEGESDIKDCKASQPCPAGQDSCFMQVNRDVNGKTTLYARCTANTTCPAKNNAWTRVSHFATDVCEACCEGNDCNKDMCNGSPPTPKPTVQGGLVAPYRLTSGIECSTCSGGDCGLTSNDAVVQCPDAFPYCMNTVENDANGNKMMTKRCASVSDCETLWWKDSSSNNICSVFDPANMYTTAFTCSYCCLTPQCNRDVHPHPDTMFIGKLK